MLKRVYPLSDKGEKNIIKGILLTTLHQLSVMLPVPLLTLLAGDMLSRFLGEKQGAIPLFPYWAACLVLLLLVYGIYLKTYTQTYITSGQEGANIRLTLAEKFRRLPLSYFGEKDLSDLTSALMDDATTIEKTLVSDVNNLFAGILSSVVLLITLFLYDWRMALSLFVWLPVTLLLACLSRLATERTNKKNRGLKLAISEGFQEFLENIKVIQTSPKKETYLKSLGKKIKRIVPWLVLYEFLVGIFLSTSYNILRLGLGLVIITGAGLIVGGELSMISFLLFIFVAVRVYDPLTTSLFKIGEFIFSLVSAQRIRTILQYPEQTGDSHVQLDRFDIEYDHVNFAYNQEEVIKDVSFVAKQGEITALVGPSGSGKSTLSKLACRFWDVKRGAIRIGGRNINEIAPEALLQYFSIVFQDVVLFNDTIRNNIKIGNKNATQEEVYAAARMARCDDFIERMPNGYDTVIGENGQTLSGGERQRISIARAFLKQAPIILLDEATASLDPENETLIQQAIGQLIQNKTVLIIAHRLRSVENCDQIVVLDKGKIQETGTHMQLMEKQGLYHHLFELQRKSSRWSLHSATK